MNIETFIKRLQEELDDLALTNLEPDSVFQDIEGWSSLYSLVLMALVSTEYSVELSGQQIRSIRTVRDLYDIVSNSAP